MTLLWLLVKLLFWLACTGLVCLAALAAALAPLYLGFRVWRRVVLRVRDT